MPDVLAIIIWLVIVIDPEGVLVVDCNVTCAL